MDKVLLELYEKQAQIIYKYLLKQGCSRQDGEDIIQESFTKLVTYIDGLDKVQLSSWLFRVAVNDYKNRCKKRKYESVGLKDNVDFVETLARVNRMEEIIISKENGKEIRECLGELNQTMRELLRLKYDLELSYKEISILLGMKEEQVKTYLYRAREAFKKKWREKYEG